ncbi:glycerophosphodiester phosphodiesterase, partial [Streptomyces sp. P01-F02]|nr:glycerophosphodiester phosphodiesterase [Streptomyces poriferorum]
MTERAQASPGRRTVMGVGAAVLGTAALGVTGTAQAADRSGGRGGHRLDL